MLRYSLVNRTKLYGKNLLNRRKSRRWKICGVVFALAVLLFLILVYVVFPLVFMNDIRLQRLLMFMNIYLPTDRAFFENFKLKGLRNLYVPIEQSDNTTIELGVWHLLPLNLTNETNIDDKFDYDEALMYSNYSVLISFHGAGEARSYFIEKTETFRQLFHVIAFDYRSFADSTRAVLSEEGVVSDCVQLYKWLMTKTTSPIFIWSHSLGTALASRTVMVLQEDSIEPSGLFLESGFTSIRELLPLHPYGRFFAWLPWFKQTVLEPLERNNLTFTTADYVNNITCPLMIMHARDDSVVPYTLGHKLYEVARSRKILRNIVLYYEFPARLGYNHYFIYQDPKLPEYITKFTELSLNETILEDL